MSFTQTCWQETQSIYDAIIAHPFNRELAAGTLDSSRFAYYVQQDSLYLRDYARCLALLAAKAPASDEAADLLDYAREGIAVEQALHGGFFAQFKIETIEHQEPACFAYTQFLLARVALESYPVGLAAVLPCFWIYREVGLDIAKTKTPSNPYQAWIDTYSDPAFGTSVDRMLALTDAAAAQTGPETKAAMKEAFVHSTRCEWLFWDAAYQLQRWPIS